MIIMIKIKIENEVRSKFPFHIWNMEQVLVTSIPVSYL